MIFFGLVPIPAVALVFGAFAGSATAKKMSKKQKANVRAELRKAVKKNPWAYIGAASAVAILVGFALGRKK